MLFEYSMIFLNYKRSLFFVPSSIYRTSILMPAVDLQYRIFHYVFTPTPSWIKKTTPQGQHSEKCFEGQYRIQISSFRASFYYHSELTTLAAHTTFLEVRRILSAIRHILHFSNLKSWNAIFMNWNLIQPSWIIYNSFSHCNNVIRQAQAVAAIIIIFIAHHQCSLYSLVWWSGRVHHNI